MQKKAGSQPAVDDLAIQYMRTYNQGKAIVYNTAQLYRHDRLAQLTDALNCQDEGFIYAVKIVRGAYMEKERERASRLGYALLYNLIRHLL